MDGDDRGIWVVVALAGLTTAAVSVALAFLFRGAWPVGSGIGVIALASSVVLGAVTVAVWIGTRPGAPRARSHAESGASTKESHLEDDGEQLP